MSTLNVIGWVFLVMSWVIPYVMRKRVTTFEQRMKSYNVGIVFSAVALAFFVGDMVIRLVK
jgi:hypothetical protein